MNVVDEFNTLRLSQLEERAGETCDF